MTLALYLVVVDANNRQLLGSGTPTGLTNPFRSNAPVEQPIVLSDATFGGTQPPTTQTGGAKVDLTELEVTLPDDSIAVALFRLLVAGSTVKTVDVLAVTTGNAPKVVSGYGLGGASGVFVKTMTRTVSSANVVTKVGFEAQFYAVGSAPRIAGAYQPFTFVTYDAIKNMIV